MKFIAISSVFSLLGVSGLAHALSFAPDTVFLMADTPSECEAEGGEFMKWEGNTYCTKAPVNIVFSDVPREHPHSEAIAYAAGKKIVSGYDDGTFRPEDTINRVELIKILVESQYRETPACDIDFNYTDTLEKSWYQRYLQVASCLEIVAGYPDGSFKPDAPVFITEASKMIANAYQFEMAAPEASWYEPFVKTLSVRGALPTSIESIRSELTRGQMAEIIYRLESGKTGLASHTLSSLEAGALGADRNEDEFEIEAELDRLFNELDLKSLLDS